MGKEVRSVRLPTDVAEQVTEYADKRGISEADAMRRLVKDGLQADRQEATLERIDDLEAKIDDLQADVNRPLWKKVIR